MYLNEFHILESSKGDGSPISRSRDGQNGVFVFSDAKAAGDFAFSRGHEDDWRSVQLNAEEMLDWIRETMSIHQVTVVWTDPKTENEIPTETSAEVLAECVAKICGK